MTSESPKLFDYGRAGTASVDFLSLCTTSESLILNEEHLHPWSLEPIMVPWGKNVKYLTSFWQRKLLGKRSKTCCEIMSLIRTRISFSLLHSMLLCIRGAGTILTE